MDDLLNGLRAAAEATRVRLLFILSHGEFNVSELTQILGQSQPRVSRHLKLMVEAGLVDRHKEGNWVLFRLRENGVGGALTRVIAGLLPASDPSLARDLARIDEVKRQRAEIASNYFAENASNWARLRSLHVREEEIERAMLAMLGSGTFNQIVDLGTGTGRILSLLAPRAQHAVGLDSSREMIAIARANIEREHLRHAQIRHGDIYALPFSNDTVDLITIHQVLHFLDEPSRALIEARRILAPDGRLLIVDFAPHQREELQVAHAHRRLGISSEQLSAWLAKAGLALLRHEIMPPPATDAGSGLSVSLWLATHRNDKKAIKQSENKELRV